ncbi:MAG TPA: protein kinase, partial [Baekduia sp.]|nr:protein kinase [Baekduia sp.]
MTNGTVISGRYEIGDRLGLGGMSTVHVAFDRRLEREVAIKLLAEHLAHDAQFVSRFRREALAAARLVHPNIVQVFDFGLDESTDRHYIVMERIQGPSMAEVLRDRGHLPVDEVLDVISQSCRGLDYAHRNGVVHRDVKPGNLLISEAEGIVKLADFGIAKAMSEESSITQVGSVLGTAAYLAPEQAAGEEVGPAADIYALGVVTYQLLSGRLPYEAQSLTELALKQQREAPALLSEFVAGVSPPLAQAVDRALALEPQARYEGADRFAEALAQGAGGVAPPTAATSVARADDTSATRVIQRDGTQEWDAPVPARRPRAPRTGAHAPA